MWKAVRQFIDNYDSFLITTHVNPDGDAIGSEMALKAFLEDQGKSVVVVNASITPESLAFLDPEKEIKVFTSHSSMDFLEDIDGAFILDLNNWDQLGMVAKPLKKGSMPRVCIDHHEGVDEEFADVIVSDTSAAATGILIYELIRSMNGHVTRPIADAIYSAVVTDTGTFRFTNTDARAFRTAADLYDAGADPFEIYRHVFASKGWGTGKLLGPVMSTVSSAAEGRLAWFFATREMVETSGGTYDDMDGFVDLIRAIKDVELVLFFKETVDGNVKVSLRSNGSVDAFAIANHLGGGGHKMASGVRLDGPLEAAIKSVVEVSLQMDGIKAPID